MTNQKILANNSIIDVAIRSPKVRFGWGDLVFAYRHMEWDIGDPDIIDDIQFSGPGLLARWTF